MHTTATMGLCERFEIDLCPAEGDARSPALVNYRKLMEERKRQRQEQGASLDNAVQDVAAGRKGGVGSAPPAVDASKSSKLEARLLGASGGVETTLGAPTSDGEPKKVAKKKKKKALQAADGEDGEGDGFIDDGETENGYEGDPFEDVNPAVPSGGASRMNEIIQKYSNIQQELARRCFKVFLPRYLFRVAWLSN